MFIPETGGESPITSGPQGACSNQDSILDPGWPPQRQDRARLLGSNPSPFFKGSAPSGPSNPIGSSWDLNGGGPSAPSPETDQRSDHRRPLKLQRLRERLELAAIAAGHPRREQVAALQLQEVGL